MGCRSSVVRALVAKARGPGFDSLATTKFFHTFYRCSFPTLECDSFQHSHSNSSRFSVQHSHLFLECGYLDVHIVCVCACVRACVCRKGGGGFSLGQLCQHKYDHNKCAKALSIMPAIGGFFLLFFFGNVALTHNTINFCPRSQK